MLQSAGIEEAECDARLLLEYSCKISQSDLLAHGDRTAEPQDQAAYEDLLARRSSRIPLQLLTGVQEFMGLEFAVNGHVLIPRQDTEILVEEALRDLHDGMRILDMCTGSGCILISLLRYSNGCQGVGADVSRRALEVARENAGRLLEAGRAEFIQGNLFENVQGKFDLIVSNPPYIPRGVIETLMPEVREHEPRLALDGGEDGLFFYREILAKSGDYLYGGGRIFFEIGCGQAAEVSSLMEQAGFLDINVVKDYAGLDRVVYGTLGFNLRGH